MYSVAIEPHLALYARCSWLRVLVGIGASTSRVTPRDPHLAGLTKSIALDGRACSVACGQIDYGNVESAMAAQMSVGMPQVAGR